MINAGYRRRDRIERLAGLPVQRLERFIHGRQIGGGNAEQVLKPQEWSGMGEPLTGIEVGLNFLEQPGHRIHAEQGEPEAKVTRQFGDRDCAEFCAPAW